MFPTTIMFGRELLGMPVWLTDFLSCLISLQLEVSFSISIRVQEKRGTWSTNEGSYHTFAAVAPQDKWRSNEKHRMGKFASAIHSNS